MKRLMLVLARAVAAGEIGDRRAMEVRLAAERAFDLAKPPEPAEPPAPEQGRNLLGFDLGALPSPETT